MRRLFSIFGWLVLIVGLVGVSYRKVLAVRANALVVAFTLERRDKSEQYLPKFLSDKLAWKRIELFNPAPPPAGAVLKDAGDWLNRRVTWLPAGASRGSGSAPKSAMLKGFADAIRDAAAFTASTARMAAWTDDWATHASEIFPPGKTPFADFTWMRTLAENAKWDLDQSEAVRKALSLNSKLLAEELPEPAWADLATWQELRLLHGIAMHDLAPALQDSRTLVRLLLTTERLSALMLSIQMLNREGQAIRVFRERVNPRFVAAPPAAPSAITPETLTSLEGYLLAFPGILDTASDPETLSEAFQADGMIFGLCAELNALGGRILRDRALLSDAYGYSLEAIGRVIRDPGNRCRIPQLKKVWSAPEYIPPQLTVAAWQPNRIPELPGFALVSTFFDWQPSSALGGAGDVGSVLPMPLRASSAVRRAMGVAFKRADEPTDPWARYARQK